MSDSPYELVAYPPNMPGASLHLAKGMFPTGPDGGFLTTRPSPPSVLDALGRVSALSTSRPVREHIGDGLAVAHIDLRLSPTADSGFGYLAYRGNSVNSAIFKIKKGMAVRVYVGAYRAAYGRELLNVAVEAPAGKAFKQWTKLAERALATLRLPKGLVPAESYDDWGS